MPHLCPSSGGSWYRYYTSFNIQYQHRLPVEDQGYVFYPQTWGGHRGLVVGVFDCRPTSRWFESASCQSTLTFPQWPMTLKGHSPDFFYIGDGTINRPLPCPHRHPSPGSQIMLDMQQAGSHLRGWGGGGHALKLGGR